MRMSFHTLAHSSHDCGMRREHVGCGILDRSGHTWGEPTPIHTFHSHLNPQVWCSRMKDRLAVDGTIAPLRAAPDISVQYPFECGLRQVLSSNVAKGQFNTLKTSLFRVWPRHHAHPSAQHARVGQPRQLRNPHALVNASARTCTELGPYAHYTLTAEAMRSGRRKYLAHVADAQTERTYLAEHPNASYLSWAARRLDRVQPAPPHGRAVPRLRPHAPLHGEPAARPTARRVATLQPARRADRKRHGARCLNHFPSALGLGESCVVGSFVSNMVTSAPR